MRKSGLGWLQISDLGIAATLRHSSKSRNVMNLANSYLNSVTEQHLFLLFLKEHLLWSEETCVVQTADHLLLGYIAQIVRGYNWGGRLRDDADGPEVFRMQPEHFLNQAHALFLAGGHHGRFIQPQELFHFRRWLDATRSARLIPHTPLRCPIGVHGNRVIPQGRKQRIVTATAHVEGDLMLSRTGAGEPV